VATKPKAPKVPAKGCGAVRAEVGKYSDWDREIIAAVALAENRTCNPKGHNLTASETHRDRKGNIICVGSYGVLQVGCLHYRADEDRDDLKTNVRVAHRVWLEAKKSYRPWTMYRNGTYKEFLK
jgi:hypothetical protein